MVTEFTSSSSNGTRSDAGSSAQAPSTTEQGTAGGEEGRSSNAGRWLAALRTIVGLESPTLRDTIEDALKAEGGDDEAFTRQEREMLLRLLHYKSLRVEDVMVPRADIIAVDENESIDTVLQTFVEAGVSRMPLFHDSLDDPRGMIHVKDVVLWLTQTASVEANSGSKDQSVDAPDVSSGRDEQEDIRKTFPELDFSRVALGQPVSTAKVSRKVIFVPPSMPAMNLLLRMQSTRMHMALVVDEYGGTDGLVTIEDLIEQIVGQIEDEHDEDEASNIIIDPRLGMVAAARTPIEELEKLLETELALDDDDDVDTLGGLVFALAGSVPVRGEIVRHPAGVEFEVLDADPRRIKRLRISRPDSSSEQPDGKSPAEGNKAA
jgi:CBS domain containing-hemolysin-like protein